MDTRCSYCACLLRYERQEPRKPLGQVTPTGIINPQTNREIWLYRENSAAPENVWCIGSVCPGCGSAHRGKQEFPFEEAERLIAEQNALLETPAAKHAAEHWEEGIARCGRATQQRFLELFTARFPILHAGLRQSKPRDEMLASFQKCNIFLVLGIQPKTPPPFDWVLSVQLMPDETILFFKDWHGHYRHQENPEYLREVIEAIEDFMAPDFQETCVAYLWEDARV
jgi:hypothetical protein